MRQKYHNRTEIVHRLNQPGSRSITVISEETGAQKATFYACLANDKRSGRSEPFRKVPLAMTKRNKQRSPSVKFALLGGSHGLQGEALQTYCNQKGVTVDELLSWRDLALSGIELEKTEGFAGGVS